MSIRPAVRSGSFYEASPHACRRHVELLLEQADLPGELPPKAVGGLVPHAGWVYSGRLAALTFKALLTRDAADTIVLFGADHTGGVELGEVWDSGAWQTPLGDVAVDEELVGEFLAASPLLRANPAAHHYEHSLEVQIPFLQSLQPGARIVPIAVRPSSDAVAIGRAVGSVLAGKAPGRACVVGSSDLTHHGGHFGNPGGTGPQSEAFACENDRRMLDLIEAMDAAAIVPEAMRYHNACGAGAIAATLAACREMGATKGHLLAYTNSYRVIHETYPDEPDDTTVGYASVLFV